MCVCLGRVDSFLEWVGRRERREESLDAQKFREHNRVGARVSNDVHRYARFAVARELLSNRFIATRPITAEHRDPEPFELFAHRGSG